MTEVRLYQPGNLDQVLQFPTHWNELLKEELQLVCAALLSSFTNPTSVRAVILTGLLKIRAAVAKAKLPGNLFNRLDAEDAFLNGYPLCDFIFSENNLTTQPYPRLSFGLFRNIQFSGPLSNFDNITCGEFEDAEIFFHQFRENPSPEPLARMAAILWRPANTPYISISNSRKQEYNAEKTVPLMLKLPAWKQYAIYTWYTGCRNTLPKLFPHAFGNGGGKPDMLSFTKCIHAGAGPKNGSRDEIRMMMLKEFFFDIDLESKKAEELKNKSNAQ